DIVSGKYAKVNAKVAEELDTEAMVFYRPFPLRSITVKDLGLYMYESLNFSDFVWYFLALAIVTALGMLMPKINHMLFSDVVDYGSTQLLLAVMVFMACITISTQLFGTIKEIFQTRINTKLNLSVQAATMMRILSLPTDFFREYTAGELKAKVQQMNQLCSLLVNAIFTTGFTGLF
ncbi:MAG: NHLP family bacteriocin export ABC transporter permease/ATPase subunit, partial [Lachnospiraceae bacterium]|nr:NHLP family bacteriocin export ABC transporter permease/ATPase subunit [Candidatus Equihabitans merdae]